MKREDDLRFKWLSKDRKCRTDPFVITNHEVAHMKTNKTQM